VIVLLAILASGIGMLLSVLYIRARDVQPIWEVTTQLLFYAAPIIYPVFYYNHHTTAYYGKNCVFNSQTDTYFNILTHKVCGPSAVPIGNNLHLHFIGHFLMTNPIAALIAQARHALVGGHEGVNPSAAFALGGWEYALIPLGIILVVFVLGVVVFHHEAPRISENL
jgi:ABC-2 type transport system permease protein